MTAPEADTVNGNQLPTRKELEALAKALKRLRLDERCATCDVQIVESDIDCRELILVTRALCGTDHTKVRILRTRIREVLTSRQHLPA